MNTLPWTVAVLALMLGTQPPAPKQIFVDRVPTPSTLEALTAKAQAVAKVRIRSVREVSFQVDRAPRPASSFVEYQAQVLEPAKADRHLPGAGNDIKVLAVGSLQVHERDLRPFKVGEELVLFLGWVDRYDAYMVVHGPDGVFDVSRGVVQPFGQSHVAQAQRAARADQLMTRIKQAADH